MNETSKPTKRNAASLRDILGTAAPTNSIPKKWEKYHSKLIQMRSDLRENISNKNSLNSGLFNSSDRSADLYDQASADSDFSTTVRSLKISQQRLKEIEDAIQRIANGTFGVCVETGQPISPERLEDDPSVRYSAEGAKLNNIKFKKTIDEELFSGEDKDIDLNVNSDENAFLSKDSSSDQSELDPETEFAEDDIPKSKKKKPSKETPEIF